MTSTMSWTTIPMTTARFDDRGRSGARQSSLTANGPNLTAARLGRGAVAVVPVTSNVARIYPFQVLLPAGECGIATASKAQAEQIRSVAVERLREPIGRLPADLMARLDEALRLHLAL